MRIHDCMSPNVQTISKTTSLKDAAETMARHDIGLLPVAEEDNLIGIVTDRDIAVRGIGCGLGPDATASDVMTDEVLYCSASDAIGSVLDNMASIQVRRLPVVDANKQLVGIVSMSDLARAKPTDVGPSLVAVARPSSQHSQSLS